MQKIIPSLADLLRVDTLKTANHTVVHPGNLVRGLVAETVVSDPMAGTSAETIAGMTELHVTKTLSETTIATTMAASKIDAHIPIIRTEVEMLMIDGHPIKTDATITEVVLVALLANMEVPRQLTIEALLEKATAKIITTPIEGETITKAATTEAEDTNPVVSEEATAGASEEASVGVTAAASEVAEAGSEAAAIMKTI